MKKKLLLFSTMTLLVLSFAGCAKNDSVDVELTEVGDAPIKVISTIQDVADFDLMEAKKIVDGVPAILMEDVPKDEAEQIKISLEEAGATVTIK